MTLDEAILHCEDIAKNECNACGDERRQLAEWLKELKQLKEREPCKDAISRQVAIDVLHGYFDGMLETDTWSPCDVYGLIELLPSAQPEQVCVATVALTDEQVKEVVEKAKNAVISVIEPEPHWIPCSEKMPSETVIATVETKAFKHRYVCEAVWIPRWTWKASFDEWEDCSEYNEDDDEYYVLEGWYERVHNWDEYAYVAIDDDVIAWMSMPIPYCGGGNGE